ncbi:hypothetical protein H5410_023894 [Solanum commersonii]|uniref:Ubiquitin-like protease family profile domain-containing protein n=1 Tax=Solanum commersonii TaxID=4109 RepID=A0A9J5ZKE7_SOLCO|nr:hypothetical protein H5410_023894 [Solanum commersonii]
MGGWDNIDDVLQMAILYFIHIFVFSQLGDAPIPIEDFLMVENGSYQQFPWGQLAFTKLMKSFRKEYKPDKQMYRLNGFPYTLNIWVYECVSVIHNEIAVKEGNSIPRVCNWKVVGAKLKFEMFMENIFTEDNGGISMPYIVDDSVDKGHEAPQLHKKVLSGDEYIGDTIQQDFEKHASNPDSTTSASISSGTEAVIDAIVYKLPNEPINVAPPKNPSEDKYRGKSALFGFDYIDFVVAFPLDKNWFYTMSQPYKCWTDQEHIARADVVYVYKRSIKDVINEFYVPAALPWHLVDEVYIPINCDKEFHWVLAVVLRERLIQVYDSSLGSMKKVQSDEIKQLSIILPNYLQDSRFFDKIDIIDWVVLNAYKDNKTSELLGPQRPFEVEFARDIMQQESDSLHCGTYVAAFVEFLSDKMKVPSILFEVTIFAQDMQHCYGNMVPTRPRRDNVSENDDPTRLNGVFIPLTDDELD